MRTERVKQTLEVFRGICLGAGSLSEDSKHKVGAIVFRKNFQSIPAIAFNGNYPGGPNERESLESGKSGFIHAEVNALLRAGLTPETAHAFAIMISLSPCSMCARIIAASNIKSVFFLKTYEKDMGFVEIFENAGIKHLLLEEEADKYPMRMVMHVLE